MEDKTFELVEKLYIEMQNGFKEVNKKLDGKADKTDIVLLEQKFN